MRRLVAYPIVFLILYIVPTVNRIYDLINDDDSFILYFIHGLSATSLGFANCIIYGILTAYILTLWRGVFASIGCTCCGTVEHVNENSMDTETISEQSQSFTSDSDV